MPTTSMNTADYVRSLIESSLDPLVTIAPDGAITDVNKATELVTGLKRKQLVGTDFSSYFTDPEYARAGYLQVYEQGSVRDYPLDLRHVDGHTTPVLYNASVYRNEQDEVVGVFAAARDISQQKSAEQQLKQVGEYTRSLIESSLDPLVTIAPDGAITDVNKATELVTGRTREQLVGTDFSSYFTDPEYARAGYLQVYEQGSVRDYPLDLRHADGHITPVLYNASVYKNEQGEVEGVFAAARDISQQKSAEQQLKQVGEYTRSLIESSVDPFVTISVDGKIMDVNDATEKVTGVGRDDLIGSDFSNNFTDPEYARAGYQKVFTEGFVTDYPLSIRRRDGQITHVLYNASVYRDAAGVVQGVFAAARDITAQKEAEERIRKIARYDSAHSKILTEFNSSQDRVIVLTHLLNILAENNNYLMSAFYGFDEWEGVLNCEATHGLNDSAQAQYKLGEGLIGECAKTNRKIVLHDVDNDDFVIDVGFSKIKPRTVIITPVSYQEKRLGVFLMVSRETASQDELMFIERLCVQTGVALHNLKQYEDMTIMTGKLRDRNEEIELKNKQLDEASKMKSEFLANMSHELRTPLNAILGFSEAMRDNMFGDVNEKQEDGLGVIYESGQHLLSLINDILDLSKIEAGKMELDCTNFNLNDLVDRSISIIKEKANKHNIHLTLDLDSQLGEMSADERKVKQILFNILSNATKFTPDNGTIAIKTKLQLNVMPKCSDSAESSHRRDYITISISDTGIGIAEKDLDRLFTPFEQLDGSFSKKYQGTGLGLAMVKRLAELHHGCVNVESTLGEGSCFTVWLPVENMWFSAEQEDYSNHGIQYKKKVLVMNHDDRDAAIIRTILEGSDIEVYRTSQISEIDSKVIHYKIDAVLAEVGDRELDQIQQCQSFSDPNKDIPLILVQMGNLDLAGIAIKPRGIVNKPINKDSLLKAVVSAGIPINKPLMKDYSVLIVDDDPNSVELISTYLQNVNIDLKKAYSGEQAITHLKHATPDLIILDLMMPGVTGFDVVAYMQTNHLHHIPVVIVTAKIITENDISLLSGKVRDIIEKFNIDQQGFVSYIDNLLRHSDDG
ncbi:MAG: PAS domain S-box protein [Methylophaga sp.]|nr:PAS domain S-box protein [Methylophaga sp.]